MDEEIQSQEEINLLDTALPKEINEGEIVPARVIEVTPKSVVVDLGLKAEGLIPREEFSSVVLPGEEIYVLLQKKENSDGHPWVSYRQAQLVKTWEKLERDFRQNPSLKAIISRKIKGGFFVTIKFDSLDVNAFLPAGEIIGTYNEINRLVPGKEISVKIIELTPKKKNIVVSEKKHMDDFLNTLKEGEIIKGRVAKITDFGAFVELKSSSFFTGMKGLLHISDISWGRVGKVENFVRLQEEIETKILKIDREKRQISLSLKELKPYPWDNVESKYRPGEIVSGKVTSVTKFGLFVELEPGVEGLIHISELSWKGEVKNSEGIVKPGETLKLQVLSVDQEKEKISLSLKRTLSNPWEEAKAKYPSGTRIWGEVTHLTPFGAFVKLPEGIEGLIHISDFSWTRKVRHPRETVKVGENIEVMVIEVIPEKEKIILGLKQLIPDPYAKYQPGMNVEGKVSKINDFGILLKLESEIEGMIHYSEIPLPKGRNLRETFQTGKPVVAKIIRVSPAERKIALSIKKYEKEKEWQEMRKYLDPSMSKVTLGEIVDIENKKTNNSSQ